MSKLQQLQQILEDRFIGEVDTEALEDAAADAMVRSLGDRWSHYMDRDAYLAYQDTMSNSYVGVGVTIRVREDGQGFDVIAVTEGGPAATAGLAVGDRLVAVDSQTLIGSDVTTVSGMIRGEEGTEVSLTVIRGEQEQIFRVTRSRFQTPVVSYQMLEDKIGLVRIENFDERCAEETIAAVEDLLGQEAVALIFDVRDDPGGYKRELVEVLDYLLPEGEIFRTVDYRGREEVDRSDKDCVDLPMAVLMNGNSYSAAEFFAAALDEYDVAITVGEKTCGKGHFQNTFPLKDGSAVTLSVGKYFTPKGRSLAGVGLEPDVEVVLDQETADKLTAGTLEPEEDPQIQAAIAALKEFS